MTNDSVIKIKDSVDLFLSNDSYIMAYYMNTRQRKSFRVNEEMIHLLENIDGYLTIGELKSLMNEKYNVDPDFVDKVVDVMESNKIITKVDSSDAILSQEDIYRYSRQINYFSEFLNGEKEGMLAQKKLMDSHIIIFGCGAIGGNIALQLTMAGVGEITLFDFDNVEKSDAARHMYYREEFLSENKTKALAEELIRINSSLRVNTINESMKPKSDIEQYIIGKDFVVNTLDEPYIGYTSSKISRICVKHHIPHFVAGGFDAHLASTGELIIPYTTPCVECYAGHFKEVLKDWKPKEHPVKGRYTEIGGLASMSLFSTSYACIEIIKCLAGLVEMDDNFKVRGEFLFTDMSLTYLNVKKNPNCPVCGGALKNES